MLTDIGWQQLRANVSYIESDKIAVIRTGENAIQWAPVFLNVGTNKCFIRSEGNLVPLEEVKGFERYTENKFPVKRMFDTATLEYIPV